MNKFLFALFLLISFSAFSQKKLYGTYRTSPEHKRFTFFKNGMFEYSEGDDLYSIRGKGEYILKKDILKLYFIGYEPLKSSFVIENKNCDTRVADIPSFSIKDKETNLPIPLASIYLKLKYSQKRISSSGTDQAGIAITSEDLLNTYQDSSVVALISCFGYEDYSFEFVLKPCKQITIALVEPSNTHNRKISGGTVKLYKLKKFSRRYSNGIILHGDTSSVHPEGYDTTLYKIKEKN